MIIMLILLVGFISGFGASILAAQWAAHSKRMAEYRRIQGYINDLPIIEASPGWERRVFERIDGAK